MPIYAGSSKIKEVYAGSRKIGKVYKGSTLVYQNVPKVFRQGPSNHSNYAININSIRVGIPLFAALALIQSISGAIGQSGSVVYYTSGLDTGARTAGYQGTVNIDGFPFHVYHDFMVYEMMPTGIFVSPRQLAGDNALEGYLNPSTFDRPNDYVGSISGNTFTPAGSIDVFPITNTPVPNYIYRP